MSKPQLPHDIVRLCWKGEPDLAAVVLAMQRGISDAEARALIHNWRHAWLCLTESELHDEIKALRALVREMYEPACAEMGVACEHLGDAHPGVLARALEPEE